MEHTWVRTTTTMKYHVLADWVLLPRSYGKKVKQREFQANKSILRSMPNNSTAEKATHLHELYRCSRPGAIKRASMSPTDTADVQLLHTGCVCISRQNPTHGTHTSTNLDEA